MAPKTISRWLHKRTLAGPTSVQGILPLVHARDPRLAARLHAHVTRRITGRGLPPPPPLPSGAPEASAEAVAGGGGEGVGCVKLRADATVYAACSAVDAAPGAILPALLAAVRRARELGVTLEDLERELTPLGKPAKPKS